MRGDSSVLVGERRRSHKQRVILVVQIRDYQIRDAVTIDVSDVDTHPSLRIAIGVIGDFGIERGVFESPVTLVDKQQIRRGVASHKQIGPTVVIEIDGNHSQSAADHLVQPRARADIGKRSVAVVVIERQRHSFVRHLRAIGAHAIHLAFFRLVKGKLRVVSDDQVE